MFYKKNDIRVDLLQMVEHFPSEEEKDAFFEWFTLALTNVEIINKLRHVEVCHICNEFMTLKSTGKKFSSYEFRIPNGESDLIVSSAILHFISVHNLIPNKVIINALEKIKPRVNKKNI